MICNIRQSLGEYWRAPFLACKDEYLNYGLRSLEDMMKFKFSSSS